MMSDAFGSPAGDETVDQVLAIVDGAWDELISAITAFPPERAELPGVCGDWSLKSVVAHIAFWNQFEVTRIANNGQPNGVDWQALNDKNVAETKEQPYESAVEDLRASHEAVMGAIRAKPDASPAFIRSAVLDHYVEHAAEIRAALANA